MCFYLNVRSNNACKYYKGWFTIWHWCHECHREKYFFTSQILFLMLNFLTIWLVGHWWLMLAMKHLKKKSSLFQCHCDATLAWVSTYCQPKKNSLTQFLLPCCYDWQKIVFITNCASPGVVTHNSRLPDCTEGFSKLHLVSWVYLHHTRCTDYTHYIDYTDHCIVVEHFHTQVFLLWVKKLGHTITLQPADTPIKCMLVWDPWKYQ